MKGSMLRIFSAMLLLLIGIGILSGIILAVPEKEDVKAWTKISFQTRGKQTVSVYDVAGILLETMVTGEDGKCTSELLEEGIYYGVCREGLVKFTLTAHGIREATGSAVAADKQSLIFSPGGQFGELRIYGNATREWYTYTLSSQDYSCSRTLRCESGKPIECVIENLPYGAYTLTENNRILCRVEITEDMPVVEVSLP